jgi:hypothetical protein
MKQIFLDKRSSLKQIIILSCIAIDKLDDVIYYRNIMSGKIGVNKAHFTGLLEEALSEFTEVIKQISELSESLSD